MTSGARALQLGEIQRAFRHLRSWRDRTLFGLLLLTGSRIGEVVQLDVGDLYNDDGTIHEALRLQRRVTKGKRHGRDIPIGSDLRELAGCHWVDLNDRSQVAPLFQSRQQRDNGDRRLHERQARRVLTAAFKRAGLERASSHSLRKSAAIIMSRQGVELRVIQALLGHTTLRSTNVYLQDVKEWEKRAAVERVQVPLVALVPPTLD